MPRLKKGRWTNQALLILKERYLRKSPRGRILETPEGMLWRVAQEIAGVDREYGRSGAEVNKEARDFYRLMVERWFLPNSPTLMNAGLKNNLQYSACFVLPVEDSIKGIFEAVKRAAIIHQSGGGTGFSFSRLRPAKSLVRKSGGVASGPVSFMKIFDAATEQVKQGGRRRGANMGILRVDHPDIKDFINCKLQGGITNFNISVGATDEFMDAVIKKRQYWLRAQPGWPKTDGKPYRGGEKISQISAAEVFDQIVDAAWRTGDPGMIWLDRINNSPANPVPEMGPIEATNPCGEQPLYPNEACNLGSINLGLMTKKVGRGLGVDWERLEMVVRKAVHFLDNVIDVSPFPLPEIKEAVAANRRIGLGVMGWSDLLFQLRIPYDSRRAIGLAKKVMRFINRVAWDQSEKLAEWKGPFPNFKKSIYKEGRPKRNATTTTIAPTGSISIIANCSSGIEPVFALAYTHRANDRVLHFVNPYFKQALSRLKDREKILAWVKERGNLAQAKQVSENLKAVFKTAHEIDYQWHIKMQAAFQKYTDNAVSKTINLPNSASKEDVKKAYLLAYKLGCKGITVFRDGCRQEQVLTAGVKETKKEEKQEEWLVKPRPTVVKGTTYRVNTPVGTAFVTINHNGHGDQPLEVFINVGKAGSDVAADAEAIGRLISLCLRISSPGISPKRVAELIIDQLEGIGGGSSVGFGKDRVRSLADGIAKVIKKHIEENGGQQNQEVKVVGEQPVLPQRGRQRDICPSCGNATLVFEEGCAKCAVCGFSKC